jgi:hypothetical protein
VGFLAFWPHSDDGLFSRLREEHRRNQHTLDSQANEPVFRINLHARVRAQIENRSVWESVRRNLPIKLFPETKDQVLNWPALAAKPDAGRKLGEANFGCDARSSRKRLSGTARI